MFNYKYKSTRTLHSSGCGLALCSGGEESNQSTGEANAEDVVHVSRSSLGVEVRMKYRDSRTEGLTHT